MPKERKVSDYKAKQEVGDYMRENPKAELFDITIALNLPVEQVEEMVTLIKGE